MFSPLFYRENVFIKHSLFFGESYYVEKKSECKGEVIRAHDVLIAYNRKKRAHKRQNTTWRIKKNLLVNLSLYFPSVSYPNQEQHEV